MNFSGWILLDDIIPWVKVFNIDVEDNPRFKNTPLNLVLEEILRCDLNGGFVKNAFIKPNISSYFDQFFKFFGCNIKNSFYDIENDKIILDGKLITRFSKKTDENPTSIDAELPIDLSDRSDKVAQVLVIDKRYLYFSMTSYGFWNEIDEFLCENLKTNNLGGCLFKVGVYPEIDKLFKEIL